MPRRVKKTVEVAGSNGTITVVPNPARWVLPNRPYGYVFNRGGVAVCRYKDRQRSTGLMFLPRNRAEAVRIAEQWIRGLAAPAARPTNAAVSLADAWQMYAAAQLTGDSDRANRRRAGAVLAFRAFVDTNCDLNNETVHELTSAGYRSISARLAPGTTYRYLNAWSQFMAYCRARGWIGVDPVALVRLPEVEKKAVRVYSSSELERIDAWFADRPNAQLLWRFLSLTAARIHEALALTWNDIHSSHIDLRITKGSRPRPFPLGPFPEVVELLEQIRHLGHAPLLFGLTRKQTTCNWLKECLDELGIDGGMRPQHRFRNTAEHRWRQRGIPAEVRARLGGHSIVIMLGHYDAAATAAELEALIERATAA